MPDIEFLPESVDEADAEEELGGGGRRFLARWLGAITLAAVVVVAIVVAATRNDGKPAPTPTPTPTPLTTDVANPIGNLRPVFLGPFSGEPVQDVAVLGSSVWVLQADGLHVTTAYGRRDRLQLPANLQEPRLIADPGARLVWLIGRGVAQAFDTHVDAVIGARIPAFTDATAMGGRLYVLTDNAVYVVGEGHPRATRIFTGFGPLTSIAADPSRQRLILARQSSATVVMAVSPHGYRAAHLDRMASIQSVKATVRVVNRAIWLAGFDTGDGVVMRLDPQTLRPLLLSAMDPLIEPGGILVGGGDSVIWVRDGDGSNTLRCLSAGTGDELQEWPIGGRVASAAGRAVVGTMSGGLYLDLNECGG